MKEKKLRERLKKKGFILKSSYVDEETKIEIECENGHVELILPFTSYTKGQCKECIKEEKRKQWIKEIEDKKYTVNDITTENNKEVFYLTCPNGHERIITSINSFRKYNCEKCNTLEKINEARQYILNNNYKIIKEPILARDHWEIECENGHIRKTKIGNIKIHNCPQCNEHRNIPYTYKEALDIFNIANCILLTEENEFKNCKTRLKYRCHCGNISYTTLDAFKNGESRGCINCKSDRTSETRVVKYEEVVERLKEDNNILLTSKDDFDNANSNIEIKCSCGKIFSSTFVAYKSRVYQSCSDCAYKKASETKRHSEEHIRQNVEVNENKLLSYKYTDNKHIITYKCKCGKIEEIPFNNFEAKIYKMCSDCSLLLRSGENHPDWKGGATPLHEFLRHKLIEWKQESRKACGFKCIISNNEFKAIHHLYGFDSIIKEVMINVNMDYRKEVSLYSDDEIDKILNECNRLHKYYGLGVCLTEEVHRKFHKIYGYGNNTPEQFIRFVSSNYPHKLNSVMEYINNYTIFSF